MRTLHLGLRVADLDRSLTFYGASDPHRGNGLSHDPDGNRIELVQRPAGHPDGITAADGPG
jgi:hypothetical protein